ncbi:hypothetical protein BDQ17DRAFT_1373567 [Cyathus striatus]|nr:hypothetical protein BDQ17DRAFT_1373567 [Cyathus striatus]
MPASKLMKKVNRMTRNYTQRVVHGAVKKTKDVVVDDDYVVVDANVIRVSPAPQTKKTLKRSIQSSPCDTSSSLHKNKVRVSPSILPGANTFPSRLLTSIERGEECQQIKPSEDSDLRTSNVCCNSENKSSPEDKPRVTCQRRSTPALRSPSRPICPLPRRKIQLRQNTLPLSVASPSPFCECPIRPKENRITIQQAYALLPSVFTKLFPCKTELTDDEEELWEEVFGPVMDWY